MTKIKHFSRNNKLLLAILLLIVIIACTDITTDPINDMNDSPVISDFNFSAGDTIKFLDSTFFAFQFLATDPNKNKLTVNAQIDSGLAEISLLTHNPDKNGLVKGLFKPGKIGTYLIGINVSDGIKQETKSFPIYFYRNK
ncbi:MAG: hypothetical protein KDD94_11455, partial [Calditrichaeota bacterium]|nr:hypothetical protein [Calditrichota bacterium]